MPAYSTHCIFAKEMMPFLRQNADFEINENAVLIGTQGPDIFFFHRIFPWMKGKSFRKIGSLLHRARPSDILDAMREYCSFSQNECIAKSYIYGFILHYALDRKCHPFVYSYQEKMIKNNPATNPHTAHNIIEHSMDAYLLNKRFGVAEPVVFDTACTITNDADISLEIGKLYSFMLPKILGINIKPSDIVTAVNDTKTVQKYVLDATGKKRFFVGIFENALSPISKNYKFTALMRPRDLENAKKYGNINNEIWFSPFDSYKHNESFEDLFELAKQDAKIMIARFQAGDNTEEITNNISFLTGVEVK